MVAGVDLSTKAVDIFKRVDGDIVGEWWRCEFPPFKGMAEREALCARELRSLMPPDSWWDGVHLAGVEHIVTRILQATVTKVIQGAVIALIPPRVHVMNLVPSMWERDFCERRGKQRGEPTMPRKGVERKQLIQARAIELGFPKDFPQDVYDAIGLSWVAELWNEPATKESLAPPIP